jgi:DNA replication factor GINS
MYGDLYRAWKEEIGGTVLQPLPSDFYQRTTVYLKNLDNELSSPDMNSIRSRLLVREKEITKRLLDELKQARLRKIMLGAQNRIPIQPTELIEEEIAVITNIRQSLTALSQDPAPQENSSTSALTIVRFIQDIPEIVGVDLKIYGPFKKEDVASLPLPNAQALEKQHAVRVIEVKGVNRSKSPIRQK